MSAQYGPVIVIGGGIVGASIAWHLAKETDVIIIAGEIGGVTTPKSFAWLNAAGATEKFYYDFRRRSMTHWAEMGKELPELPIYWGGTLTCDKTSSQRTDFYDRQREWGTKIERLDKDRLSELEPEINDADFASVHWGLLVPEEGTIEADDAAGKLIADAESRGAKVLRTNATGFLKSANNGISGVVTGSGYVRGAHVVLAAGLASVALLAMENIKLPLKSTEGLIVNTMPSKKRYLSSLLRLPGIHMRQTLDGRIRFAASFAGGEPGNDPERTAKDLFGQLQKVFKLGHELEYGGFTVGVRPDPEDGYPILGSTGLDGLDVAVMHSGVTNAALVGQLLSEKILHGIEDPILEPYRLDRFSKYSARI